MRCCVRRWREQHVQHAIENTRFMACFQAVSVDGCPMRAAHHAIELRISRFQHAALRLLSPALTRCALSLVELAERLRAVAGCYAASAPSPGAAAPMPPGGRLRGGMGWTVARLLRSRRSVLAGLGGGCRPG